MPLVELRPSSTYGGTQRYGFWWADMSWPWPAKRSYLIDDGNAAVARFPEVPLARCAARYRWAHAAHRQAASIRRDMSDVFCTKAEGFRGRDCHSEVQLHRWQHSHAPSGHDGSRSPRPRAIVTEQNAKFPTSHRRRAWPFRRSHALETEDRLELSDPSTSVSKVGWPTSGDARPRDDAPERSVQTPGALRAFRELEDALLRLRINHLEVGTHQSCAPQGDADAEYSPTRPSSWTVVRVGLVFQVRSNTSRHQCLRRLDNMAKSDICP